MKKTTKGALALGSAALLLAGGAGSLAYWSDAQLLPSSTITAGSLKLSTPTCDPSWKYQTGSASAGTAVTTYVPGDKITKTCTFVVTATGQNLKATLTTPPITTPAAATGSSLTLTPSTTYKIAGTTAVNGDNAITSADNGKTVTAVFNVDIPFGTSGAAAGSRVNENDTQLTTSTLNAITVTLTQVQNTATS